MHFAAFALVGESVTDPAKYYQNNIVGHVCSLLEAMQRPASWRIVFSSTTATYGVPDRVPIVEDESQAADQSLRLRQAGHRARAGRLCRTPTVWGMPRCAISTPPAPRPRATWAKTTIPNRT